MRIVVLSASRHRNCTLKDVAGGFGTVFTVGNSPFAKLLEVAKRRIASIPNVTLAYLDSILSAHGAQVHDPGRAQASSNWCPADLYLISSSIVDCSFEREIGLEARRRLGAKVGYFGAFASAVPEFFAEAADFIVKEEIENIAPALAAGRNPRGDRLGRLCREPQRSTLSQMGSVRYSTLSISDSDGTRDYPAAAGKQRMSLHLQLLSLPGELEVPRAEIRQRCRRNRLPGKKVRSPGNFVSRSKSHVRQEQSGRVRRRAIDAQAGHSLGDGGPHGPIWIPT